MEAAEIETLSASPSTTAVAGQQSCFGAWLPSISACTGCTRSASNALAVTGAGGNDTILLRRSPANPAYAEVFVNGKREWAGLWCALGSITIYAQAGNDTITYKIRHIYGGAVVEFRGWQKNVVA